MRHQARGKEKGLSGAVVRAGVEAGGKPFQPRKRAVGRSLLRGLGLGVTWVGTAMLAWSQTPAPANNTFTNRFDLPDDQLSIRMLTDNTAATAEDNEPKHRGTSAAHSLWWRWMAPAEGYAVIDSASNSVVATRVAVYDGGKDLRNLTALTLQQASLQPAADDRYEFLVERGLFYNLALDGREGQAGQVGFHLKLYTVPEILQHPQGTNVTDGQRATLEVRALGKLALGYQWQFSSRSPNTFFSPLTGANGRTLAVGRDGIVHTNDIGWYRVVVQNSYGSVTSAVARLEVSQCVVPGPLMPTNAVVNVGKAVTFTASATGSEPYDFEWQFKPTGAAGFGPVTAPNWYPVGNQLVGENVSTDEAGEYRFRVSNVACTNQLGGAAILTVTTNDALKLDASFPKDLTVVVGTDVSFEAKVIEGYHPITYQWYYSPRAGVTNLLPGETGPELYLPGVNLTQGGSYWAVVRNRYATLSTRQAKLVVEPRPPNDDFVNRTPFVTNWPSGIAVTATNVTLTGFNKHATREDGEKAHLGRGPALSVWWSFEAPVDGYLIVTLNPGIAPQVLAAYAGDAVDTLIPQANRTNLLTRFEFLATNRVEYSFAVESQSGAFSTNLTLNLIFNADYDAPVIVRQPLDLWMMLGDFPMLEGGFGGCRDAAFVGEAVSLDGVVRYQWQRGDKADGPFVDLPNQTNATLRVSSVTTRDAGWYRLTAANSQGKTSFSQAAQLTVDIGPQIGDLGQPRPVRTNACTAARFEVKAESCSPLTYLWRHNGQPVTAPNAAGADTALLVITNLSPANEGEYDVIVSNPHLSVTSAKATLILTNTPTFTQQPKSSTKRGCESETLSVRADAACLLSYQWWFQGQPLDGATERDLRLTDLEPAHAGPYHAVVSTPYGSVTSAVAVLTVRTNPNLTRHPSTQTRRECEIVNLDVQVDAEPVCSFLAYQWIHAGTNVPGATGRVYSFEATAEAAGEYRVAVSNRWTRVLSNPAQLTVDARPLLTTEPPAFQRVKEGTEFKQEIVVSTCSAVTYQWQFKPLGSGTFTDLAPDPRRLVDPTTGVLTVRSARTNDTGDYRVVVRNVHTNSTSRTAHVRVVRPPANDDFAKAFTLGRAVPATGSGHNEFATPETEEPPHGHQLADHSVWWSWTNPFPSLVTIDLAGSDIDTTLGIYTGTVVSNLTSVAQDDNGGANGRSRVSFLAGRNKILHLAVDGKNRAEGTNLLVSIDALEITSPPVLTEQPVSMAARPGEDVTFTNVAYGSPDLVVRWYGKGEPLPSSTLTNVEILTTLRDYTNYVSVLKLKNVQESVNDAVYYAVLSNEYGTVTTRKVTLTFGSIVRGMVTDATKTDPDGAAVGIEGVLVSVGNVSTVTDANGDYELVGVEQGALRAQFRANKVQVHLSEPVGFTNLSTATASLLTATKTNFYDYIDDQFEVGKGQTVAKRFSMSPIFEGVRFVLNWSDKPADLDLVLILPPAAPSPLIDYLNKGSPTTPPYAQLEVDIRRGWGPETMTIRSLYDGRYSLYVYKYQGQGPPPLTGSSAKVVAYYGGTTTGTLSKQLLPFASVEVPTLGEGDWWHVCDLWGPATNLTWINTILPQAPGGVDPDSGRSLLAFPSETSPIARTPQALSRALASAGALPANVTYEWDFGDHSPRSQDMHPIHAYADPGWYTVSLTVTEAVGPSPRAHTTTKTNYIFVENLPPTVAITQPLPHTIFRAGDVDAIVLQAEADGLDDPMQEVEYYLEAGGQRTHLATVRTPPYTYVYPNTAYVDTTLNFVALARDQHGATTWSEMVPVEVRDLRGEILVLRNFPADEITQMTNYLAELRIRQDEPEGPPSTRPAVVKVLDQEGLRFDLVRGFKLIIWNDQGLTYRGLTDNDALVLQQAFAADIPLYLIGETLGASRDNLTLETAYEAWSTLLGMQNRFGLDPVPGPHTLRFIKTALIGNELFDGRYGLVQLEVPYPGPLEVLELTSPEFDVAGEVTLPAAVTNTPVLLRYPPFGEPDFGQSRRLVQAFRVTRDGDPENEDEAASREERRKLFLNGVAWLLRLWECREINTALDCTPVPILEDAVPDAQGRLPSGRVGEPLSLHVRLAQNGVCTAGGIVLTNWLPPHLELQYAQLYAASELADTNALRLTVTNHTVVLRLARAPWGAVYDIEAVAIPRRGGWHTNLTTLTRGLYGADPCQQVFFVAGPSCEGASRLEARLGNDGALYLRLFGATACPHQIQVSPDLRTWQDLPDAAITPDTDPFELRLEPVTEGRRFYRLRRLD